ncbi:hypothetical protein DW322_13245 [Rhodococcus rhodnii]|nr:hypothetical protein DW322_13245 [Rhodococcus rhodnii]
MRRSILEVETPRRRLRTRRRRRTAGVPGRLPRVGRQSWLGIPFVGGIALLWYAPFNFVDPVTITHAYASLDGTRLHVVAPHTDFTRATRGDDK